MANIRKWSDELDEELIKHMNEGKEKGISISLLAEEFSKKHPKFTSSKVRSHYYQIIKTQKYKDEEFDFRTWTLEEDTKLLKYVENNKETMSKIDIFEKFALENNRNPQSVASHYYQLLKKIKNNTSANVFNVSLLLNNLNESDLTLAESIINRLKIIKKYDEQSKHILVLEDTIEKLKEELKSYS